MPLGARSRDSLAHDAELPFVALHCIFRLACGLLGLPIWRARRLNPGRKAGAGRAGVDRKSGASGCEEKVLRGYLCS